KTLPEYVVHDRWGLGKNDSDKIAPITPSAGSPAGRAPPGTRRFPAPPPCCAMAFLPLRPVPLPDATERRLRHWLGDLDAQLDDPGVDWNDLCRAILTGLYQPSLVGEDPDDLDPITRLLVDQFDP